MARHVQRTAPLDAWVILNGIWYHPMPMLVTETL
jgi:hypothetical protein